MGWKQTKDGSKQRESIVAVIAHQEMLSEVTETLLTQQNPALKD